MDYANPHQEDHRFEPEDLTLVLEIPLANDYPAQCAIADQFCGKDNRRAIPIDISAEGVTLLTQFNKALQENLSTLIEAMSLITGVEVSHNLCTDGGFGPDVLEADDSPGMYRLKTDEEFWADYNELEGGYNG